MKNKTKKIFWVIWIFLGLVVFLADIITYASMAGGVDKLIPKILLFSIAVYFSVAYLAITFVIALIWAIVQLAILGIVMVVVFTTLSSINVGPFLSGEFIGGAIVILFIFIILAYIISMLDKLKDIFDF